MAPPAGTVTLLFTDIEGSTRLLDALGAEAYAAVLADHHRMMRAAIAAHDGYEVDTEGDAFFVSFGSARSAVEAAAAAQRALAAETWPDGARVRVRMGLHSGEPLVAGDRYVGVDVHRAARVMSAGHGGQVLLSQPTRDLVHQDLDGVSLRDLGEHRLKDLTLPQRLYQLVLPGLESEFAPLKTLENRPTNLPAQPTALVGREQELEELTELIARGDVRLVTLTGPGGTGKTRLALQAAAELVERYPDGVWFVNLAPLADPAQVLATIAQTLAVREEGGRPVADTLGEQLRGRRTLLLVDNFEHVLRAAPDLARLMQAAPELTVLATSRAPLQLRGEREFDVPPLALPDPARATFETLPRYAAVALFLERALAARRDFVLTAENTPAIAGICARLDGLPLAIELAAARVKLLPPAALLARLDHRLELLTGGARDLDERQQTLRAAIDWSYRLLDDEGRLLFDRMAVFAGGRTLDALEAVCNPDGELDVLAGVSALVDNNLLRQDEGPGGEPRFVMLETIHEYARERLDERGEAEALGSAHAGFFLELAERVGPQLTGEGQAAAHGLLEAEEANIAAALRFLDDTGKIGEYVRLANSLGRWWAVQGRYGEGRRILERAAAVGQDPADRARSLRLTANIAYHHGDDDAVERLAAEAADLTRGDRRAQMNALGLLALAATRRRDLRRSAELHTAILESARELGDRWAEATALLNWGWGAVAGGDFETGVELLELALALAVENGDIEGVAHAHVNLGLAAVLAGRVDDAAAHFAESIRQAVQLRMQVAVLEALVGSAAVAVHRRAWERAARLLGAADALRDEVGEALDPVVAEVRDSVERSLAAAPSPHGDDLRAGRAMTADERVAFALDG